MHDETIKEQQEHGMQEPWKLESMETLIGEVANNLNNILTVIIGACTLLEMNMAGNPEQMPFVACIQTYADQAAQLTRNLLAFNSLHTFCPQPENITDMLREMFCFLGKVIGKNIRFVTQLPENALIAMIDRGQIEQVIMNLAANSCDAMSMGGVLTITLSRIRNDGSLPELAGSGTGGYGQIAISDTGNGFGKKTTRRIFEPNETTSDLCGGRGLGLFFAQGVVSHHGGFIHVLSEAGRGTVLRIYLPLCDEGEKMASSVCNYRMEPKRDN